MKKYILLILVLAVLCGALCGCSHDGNVNKTDGGVITDSGNDNGDNGDKGDDNSNKSNKGDNNLGDDIKDGVNDICDDIGQGIDDITGSGSGSDTQQPSATAIPGTQVITP